MTKVTTKTAAKKRSTKRRTKPKFYMLQAQPAIAKRNVAMVRCYGLIDGIHIYLDTADGRTHGCTISLPQKPDPLA